MGASKCYSLMKCLLIFLNIVFLCCGVAICGVGVWTGVWGLEGGGAGGAARLGAGAAGGAGGAARLGAGAAGGAGGALAAAAAAGLAGAAAHSPALLAASLLLSALCAAAEGGAAWLVLSHSDTLRVSLREHLRHLIHTQYYSSRPAADVIDAIQHGLSCCGAESLREWENAVGSEGPEGAEGPGGPGGARGARGPGARGTLDLRVSADTPTFRVPQSCCRTEDESECEAARVVAAPPGVRGGEAGGAGSAGRVSPGGAGRVSPGLHARPCGELVLEYLAPGATVGMFVGAALLGCHAIALMLTLALLLYPAPRHLYKA